MDRAGLSDNELARRTDVDQPTVSRIRNGVRKHPRAPTIQPIADYFRISLSQLRGEEPLPWEKSDGHHRVKEDSVPYEPKRQPADDLAAYRAASPAKQVGAIRQILGASDGVDQSDLRRAITFMCELKEADNLHISPSQFAEYVIEVYNDLQNGVTKSAARAKLVRLVQAA